MQAIKKAKIKSLCETRWVERQQVFEDFHIMYEAVLGTLDEIQSEEGWDRDTVSQASGLATSIFCVHCSLRGVSLHLWVYQRSKLSTSRKQQIHP